MPVRPDVPHGEYHWHEHDEQDKFFLVRDGTIRIEADGTDAVEPHARPAYVELKGLPHRQLMPNRSTVLMIERTDVVATGD